MRTLNFETGVHINYARRGQRLAELRLVVRPYRCKSCDTEEKKR
jgi:predicted Zn-ribbon and HTH transcriptional regulator